MSFPSLFLLFALVPGQSSRVSAAPQNNLASADISQIQSKPNAGGVPDQLMPGQAHADGNGVAENCDLPVFSTTFLRAYNLVPAGKLEVIVIDHSTNAPIPDATVVVHWNQPGDQAFSQLLPSQMILGDIRLKTDLMGEFSLRLTRGLYDITVLLHGYDSETHALVEVRDSRQSIRCSG